MRRFRFAALITAAFPAWSLSLAAQTAVQIGQNFSGGVYGVDSKAIPADANGAAGPSHFVELMNGRFAVFSKADGQLARSLTDVEFWAQAGVTFRSGIGPTDPRLVFDSDSQRWFALAVDTSGRHTSANRFLLAISAGADPAGPWRGLAFAADPINGYYADFPTLGVSRAGVCLSADLQNSSGAGVAPTLLLIPKGDLIANPPSLARLTTFSSLSYSAYGDILQPAANSMADDILALAAGGLGDNAAAATHLAMTDIPAGAAANALPPAVSLAAPTFYRPAPPVQPDGTYSLDPGDSRLSASVRQAGGFLYAVQSTELYLRSAVRWYKIDARQQTIVQSGTLRDAQLDLFYPSIAANDAGTVVIACNGSSAGAFVGCYAYVGEMSGGSLVFANAPILLKAGAASYHQPGVTTGLSRWGDYSATCVDPSDSSRFWTIQQYPASANVWAAQITELITPSAPLQLQIARGSGSLVISWPGSAATAQLQSAPSLPAGATWSAVASAPVLTNDQYQVVITPGNTRQFFRLSAP